MLWTVIQWAKSGGFYYKVLYLIRELIGMWLTFRQALLELWDYLSFILFDNRTTAQYTVSCFCIEN